MQKKNIIEKSNKQLTLIHVILISTLSTIHFSPQADDLENHISATNSQKVSELRHEAEKLAESGNFIQALIILDKILNLAPDHPGHYWLRATLLYKEKRYDDSLLDLQRSIQLAPDIPAAYGLSAKILILKGRFKEAQLLALKALSLDPQNAAPATYLGHTYLLTGNIDMAKVYYQKALPLIPTEEILNSGPIADLETFLKNSPHESLVSETLSWFKIVIKPYKKIMALRIQRDEFAQQQNWKKAVELAERIIIETEKISQDTVKPEHDQKAWAQFLFLRAKELVKNNNYSKAKQYITKSLTLNMDILGETHPDTVHLYMYLAEIHRTLGNYNEAEKLLSRSLTIFENTLGEHAFTAKALNNLAALYLTTGAYNKARTFILRAHELVQKRAPRHPLLGTILTNLGQVYLKKGLYDEAELYFQKALPVYQSISQSDQMGKASLLNQLANLYKTLGDYKEAQLFYQKSLSIHEKELGPEHSKTAAIVSNLGHLHSIIGNHSKAESHLLRSLSIIRKKQANTLEESLALNNLARLYFETGNQEKSKDLLIQSITILENLFSTNHPAITSGIQNLATVLRAHGLHSKSEELYKKALNLDNLNYNSSTTGTAQINANYAFLKYDQGNTDAAIFFAKKAVNALQRNRKTIHNISKELQHSFLSSKEDIYRTLAGWLTKAGRFPEAEQVLTMLKEEEYFDYILRNSEQDNRTTQASYTQKEEQWILHYDTFRKDQIALAKEYNDLDMRDNLSSTEEARLTQLEKKLDQAQTSLNLLIDELEAEFAKSSGKKAITFGTRQLNELESHRRKIAELGDDVALIHTVVFQDQLLLILTTPDTQLARFSLINETELNDRVASFLQRLRRPKENPLPLAQELYRHLLKPLEEDLKHANAKTLMWSLDGALRYIPIAALHDGEQYITERFALALYSAATRDTLETKNGDNPAAWTVAGLGVSKAHPGFNALPQVPLELESIVRRSNTNDPDGVLPGVIHLNEEFGPDRLKKAIKKYPVLHIASHFSLNPGNINTSYLLLGNGEKITMSEFVNRRAFEMPNVDLLTLSACNTAVGNRSNGSEIESFAVLAQRRGAKSVLATLWLVDDNGTGEFMQRYYRLRTENPALSKAETLRQTQLAMLQSSSNKGLGKDYSHPFYWAPFILMGNWL